MGSRNGRPWVSQGPLDLWSSVARGLILMNFSKANKSIQATYPLEDPNCDQRHGLQRHPHCQQTNETATGRLGDDGMLNPLKGC